MKNLKSRVVGTLVCGSGYNQFSDENYEANHVGAKDDSASPSMEYDCQKCGHKGVIKVNIKTEESAASFQKGHAFYGVK